MFSVFRIDAHLNFNAYHKSHFLFFFFKFQLAIKLTDHYLMGSVLMDFPP